MPQPQEPLQGHWVHLGLRTGRAPPLVQRRLAVLPATAVPEQMQTRPSRRTFRRQMVRVQVQAPSNLLQHTFMSGSAAARMHA